MSKISTDGQFGEFWQSPVCGVVNWQEAIGKAAIEMFIYFINITGNPVELQLHEFLLKIKIQKESNDSKNVNLL